MALQLGEGVPGPGRDRLGDAADRARHLGQLDELRRCEQPVTGVAPAHQGLDPHRRAGAELDAGLEVDLHLLTEAVAAQVGQQLESLDRSELLGGAVDHVTPAGLLGVVHRPVGAPHQSLGVVAVLGSQGDAHARADLQPVLADLDRFGGQLVEAPCNLLRAGHRRVGAQQDGELVAAQAGDRVAVAQSVRHPAGDLAQQRIAVLVAEGVVDVLELVEVDHQEPDRGPRPVGLDEGAGQPLVQQGPVREPGQRVVGRLVAERLGGAGPLGDVLERDPDAPVRKRHGPHREDLVDSGELDERLVVRFAARDHVAHVVEEGVGDGDEVGDPVSDGPVVEVGEGVGGGVGGPEHEARAIRRVGHLDDDEGDRYALDEVRVLPDGGLGFPSGGLVDDDATASDDPAGAVEGDAHPVLQPADTPPRVGDPEVDLDVLSAGDQLLSLDEHRTVLGVDPGQEELGSEHPVALEAEQVDHVLAQEVGGSGGPRRLPHRGIDAVDQLVEPVALSGERPGEVTEDDRRERGGDAPGDEERHPVVRTAADADRSQGRGGERHEPPHGARAEPEDVEPGARHQDDDHHPVGGGNDRGDDTRER